VVDTALWIVTALFDALGIVALVAVTVAYVRQARELERLRSWVYRPRDHEPDA
jgi:hypothetical protein